jgi:hypothetical protein
MLSANGIGTISSSELVNSDVSFEELGDFDELISSFIKFVDFFRSSGTQEKTKTILTKTNRDKNKNLNFFIL